MKTLAISAILIVPFVVQAALTSAQLKVAQKRADDLVVLLNELGPKINMLPSAPTPSLATQFQLTGTGIDAGYTSVSFGTLTPTDAPRELTVSFKNTTGRPATFFGVSGLQPPFSFKGDAYPGTGGTCGQSIPAGSCTLIMQYAPSVNDTGTTMGDVLRHMNYVSISATPAGEELEENSNTFILYGYRRGAMDAADPNKDLSAELLTQPEAVLPGETAKFSVRIGLKNGTLAPQIFFRNVEISGLLPPFGVEKNGCAEQKVYQNSCVIQLLFQPTSAGTFAQTLALSVDIGGNTKLPLSLAISATALLPQNTLNAQNNLLVVYNDAWEESREVKNYYVSNRPLLSGVNVLGVQFPISPKCPDLPCLSESLEWAAYPRIRDEVIIPIVEWLTQNPHKNIQYVVLMRGLPTRTIDEDIVQYGQGFSVQGMVRQAVAQALSKEVFVTTLDTGSPEATKRFIDKLRMVYTRMPVKSAIISAKGTGIEGTTYYFSDSYLGNLEDARTKLVSQDFASAVRAVNPEAQIVTKSNTLPVLSAASDVVGFFIHGIYGYSNNPKYATDGTIRFSGRSGWYLMETAESFNGQWLVSKSPSDFPGYTGPWYASGSQGNFLEWFSSSAFSGSAYANTPAAAITHPLEPGFTGGHTPPMFACWESGKPFAYCAWKHDRSGGRLQAVGDPWVTR